MTGWSKRQLARGLSEQRQALAASLVLKRCFPCSTVVRGPQTGTSGMLGPHITSTPLCILQETLS